MRTPHILLLKQNVYQLRDQLANVVGPTAITALETEINTNVSQMFALGEEHFNFAMGLPRAKWRQIVSRSYYSAYNISKAVRFAISGDYSTQVTDHSKSGKLPNGFPNLNMYKNQLQVLRNDRNLCDYDHSADETELVFTVQEYLTLADSFINDSRAFLFTAKGITV